MTSRLGLMPRSPATCCASSKPVGCFLSLWVVRVFICAPFWRGFRPRQRGIRVSATGLRHSARAARPFCTGFCAVMIRRLPRAFIRNDHQKLIRAIELTRLAGQPASRVQSFPRQRLEGFRVLQIGLNPSRRLLREALDARSIEMFRAGLIEETRALLDPASMRARSPCKASGTSRPSNF